MTSGQIFGQDVIRTLLPHAGAMCLLEQVLRWDADSITCLTGSHRTLNNPLRGPNGLAAVNAIEYAAQAMALHAGLQSKADGLTDEKSENAANSAHGVIASVRSVRLGCARLDTIAEDLEVGALLISGDPLTAMYEFWIQAAGVRLITGRASVLFDVSVR